MARSRTIEAVNEKIENLETKLQKLKERCDKTAQELDSLYEEKRQLEDQELLNAMRNSSRSKAEILAFLESKA